MIYLTLFFEFFKIGLFTFGGGYGMIPLIKESVLTHGWLTEEKFIDFIGVCESTPGPIAINMASYIGSVNGGFFGSVLASLGVVLPSFIIILLVSTILKRVITYPSFQAFLKGINPVILALISSTGILLLIKCLGYYPLSTFHFNLKSFIILLLLLISTLFSRFVLKKKMNTIVLIFLSAFFGLLIYSL